MVSEQSVDVAPGPPPMRIHLPPVPASVPGARRAVGSLCRSVGLDDIADDAELLTSELMTNACRASESYISVSVEMQGDGVLVTVTDDNPNEIEPPSSCPDGETDAGRGLFLLDQIAGAWGITRHPDRKAVWFRLP